GRHHACAARPGGRTRRRAQRRMARRPVRLGGVPRRRRRAGRRLACLAGQGHRGPGRGRRRAGPRAGAAARGPPPDRLGTDHGRAGRRRLDNRRHRLPAHGLAARRRLRRTVPPRVPRGRRPGLPGTPGWLAAAPRRACRHPSRPAGEPVGEPSGPARQRGRRASAPALWSTVEGEAGDPGRAAASPRRDHLGRHRRRRGRTQRRPACRRSPRVGLAGRHRRVRGGPDRARPAHPRRDPHHAGDQRGDSTAGDRPLDTGMAVAMSGFFDAVLFDRDGTLIEDVPYNGDPARVAPMPGARPALDRLRDAGLRLGVVTNQSGLARGRFTAGDLAAVNARVEALLGPFDTWQVCPHAEPVRCACRKPLPGLVVRAAAELGTTPDRCAVVGDIGRDMAAALAAGAAGVLVPTPQTLPEEVAAAPAVAGDLAGAVDLILSRQQLLAGRPSTRSGTVLVARSDSAGDVLVTGPAIRAVAAGAERVVMLCGPRGRAAAELLPGVDALIQAELPWIDPDPAPVEPADLRLLIKELADVDADEALIFTSFHQSPLPLALLLRMAGVARISAISDDYPGSLLDVRHRVPAGIPEPERALSLAVAAGYQPDDDLRLK